MPKSKNEHLNRVNQYPFTRELLKKGFRLKAIGKTNFGNLHSSYEASQGCSGELPLTVLNSGTVQLRIFNNETYKWGVCYYGFRPKTKAQIKAFFQLMGLRDLI